METTTRITWAAEGVARVPASLRDEMVGRDGRPWVETHGSNCRIRSIRRWINQPQGASPGSVTRPVLSRDEAVILSTPNKPGLAPCG